MADKYKPGFISYLAQKLIQEILFGFNWKTDLLSFIGIAFLAGIISPCSVGCAVFEVRSQHFITWLEVKAFSNNIHCVGRIGNVHYIVGITIQKSCKSRTGSS